MLSSAPITARAAAPSSNVATAARAFGDDYPPLRGQWRIRAVGLLLVVTIVLYTPWMLESLNGGAAGLALPFALAHLFSIAYAPLSVFNPWSARRPHATP